MPDPLLVTKVSLPILRRIYVPRKKVLRHLSEGVQDGHFLTLVSAPGAWLSLDEADKDLPRFLSYLGAAFQQVHEEMGAPLLSTVQSPQLPAIKTENTNASHN